MHYVEVPTSKGTIFGDRAFGRKLKLNEVIGWDPNLVGLVYFLKARAPRRDHVSSYL